MTQNYITAAEPPALPDAPATARPTTPVIECIHQHSSIRNYKPDPLPCEWIEAIVAAGQRASSSMNFQMYAVIAVTEQVRKAAIAHLSGDKAHVAQAPVLLVWCADLSKLDRATV